MFRRKVIRQQSGLAAMYASGQVACCLTPEVLITSSIPYRKSDNHGTLINLKTGS